MRAAIAGSILCAVLISSAVYTASYPVVRTSNAVRPQRVPMTKGKVVSVDLIECSINVNVGGTQFTLYTDTTTQFGPGSTLGDLETGSDIQFHFEHKDTTRRATIIELAQRTPDKIVSLQSTPAGASKETQDTLSTNEQ